jgi:dihydropteroate synthase
MHLRCRDHLLDLSEPLVMGVLNVTPDSFSDGGRCASRDAAIEHGLRMLAEGAALIDVGGESTRPGAAAVPVAEELARVVPVVEALAGRGALVSVDTSSPVVMRAAVAAGAVLVNDVRALQSPGAIEAVAAAGCAVCLMHMQGEPRTMQADPRYDEVVTDIKAFLAARVQACRAAGIAADSLLVDPGFGFGKTLAHNLTLLARLGELGTLGLPVLVGLSRKSMLAALTGRAVGERLAGSLALALLAVEAGARIVRAHDVAQTVDAIKVWSAVRGAPPGGG